MTNPVFRISDQDQHKPGCATTDHHERLDISDLGSRAFVLCREHKGADHLCGYPTADLRLCFLYIQNNYMEGSGSATIK